MFFCLYFFLSKSPHIARMLHFFFNSCFAVDFQSKKTPPRKFCEHLSLHKNRWLFHKSVGTPSRYACMLYHHLATPYLLVWFALVPDPLCRQNVRTVGNAPSSFTIVSLSTPRSRTSIARRHFAAFQRTPTRQQISFAIILRNHSLILKSK